MCCTYNNAEACATASIGVIVADFLDVVHGLAVRLAYPLPSPLPQRLLRRQADCGLGLPLLLILVLVCDGHRTLGYLVVLTGTPQVDLLRVRLRFSLRRGPRPLLDDPVGTVLHYEDLLDVVLRLAEDLLHEGIDAEVPRLQHVAAHGARPPIVHGAHLHVALQVGPKAEALQVPALLAAHRDHRPLERERAAQLQLVGDHARDQLLILRVVVVYPLVPGVREQPHDALQRLLLVDPRRLRGDLQRGLWLRPNQCERVARQVLVLHCNLDRVQAWSQASDDVFRDVSAHVALLGRLDVDHLVAVGLQDDSIRPRLRAVVRADLHHAHVDVVVVLPPVLQVREVHGELERGAHDDVADHETVGLHDGVEGVHIPEAARRAPPELLVEHDLRVLEVEVVEAVLTLRKVRKWPPEAGHLAGAGVRPPAELVPEGHARLEADARGQAHDLDLGGRRGDGVLRLAVHELPGHGRDVPPLHRAQPAELHDGARERRHRGEVLPSYRHLPLVHVHLEDARLLRSARYAGQLLHADARRLAHRRLVAPLAVDEEGHHGLVLDTVLEPGGDGLLRRRLDGRATTEVPVLVARAAQLHRRGLGILGQQPPDLQLAVLRCLHDGHLSGRPLVQDEHHAARGVPADASHR
mmetsp:Transcript_55587/g.146348  ORF Transcript_55587/g.146348 Transcript_55587/m.146348 type:complete len:638 (-) Transcript_55587:290-2203(-)